MPCSSDVSSARALFLKGHTRLILHIETDEWERYCSGFASNSHYLGSPSILKQTHVGCSPDVSGASSHRRFSSVCSIASWKLLRETCLGPALSTAELMINYSPSRRNLVRVIIEIYLSKAIRQRRNLAWVYSESICRKGKKRSRKKRVEYTSGTRAEQYPQWNAKLPYTALPGEAATV